MPGPWLLLGLALTLTNVPSGRAQPEVVQQEATLPTARPNLEDLLRQAERLLLLGEELRRLRADPGQREAELLTLQHDWLSKRQHPGKREEETDEGVEEEVEEEGETMVPPKRQHPGRREDEAPWSVAITQYKRQHPGRRSPWLGYTVTKRQHPGKRLVDPKAQRSREEKEEEEKEDEEERELTLERRQHPGRRAVGGPCGPWRTCDQAAFLLGLLGDLSQGPQEKRQHPGRRAA
ncbi:PREDICTED: pro-thyrotropin-releasing hormone-like [Elephantulus edwardii]|uniref:pro-thyrotropin-releasing hormone-like n=1 Tax=Elephantulus edwardii TaxID=28737 RepID=UPI0003F07F9B|nr:PREDICTED: pro-thyrotropin-releasing hormone-like [Elephantulus edwardii]